MGKDNHKSPSKPEPPKDPVQSAQDAVERATGEKLADDDRILNQTADDPTEHDNHSTDKP